ncbi:hypothetical protein SE963_21405 [Escherichia coli]|nr:hypothetical protein [Escherichia coli]
MGWTSLFQAVAEPFAGAWQQGVKADPESVLSFHAVFSCISLISQDIAKMRLRLMQTDTQGSAVKNGRGYCPSLSSSQCTAESYPVF